MGRVGNEGCLSPATQRSGCSTPSAVRTLAMISFRAEVVIDFSLAAAETITHKYKVDGDWN